VPEARHRIHVPTSIADWWNAKASRERRLLAAIAVIAGMIVLWVTLWQPLVHDSARMRVTRTQEAVAFADARRMAEETAGLAKAPAPPAPSDARPDLDRVLAQHGLRGAVTQLAWHEGRANVVFGAVGYDALIDVLEALQRDARLRVIEARLTGRVEPQTVRAEITLGR
jgi:type II secretory pathway component PulM